VVHVVTVQILLQTTSILLSSIFTIIPYFNSGLTLYIVVAMLYNMFMLALMLLLYKYFIHSDDSNCNNYLTMLSVHELISISRSRVVAQ